MKYVLLLGWTGVASTAKGENVLNATWKTMGITL